MPTLTPFKRSSPSMHLIQQRLQARQFSSLPLINVSNNKKDSTASSFIKWISGVAVGSSLGLVYWYSTSSSDWSSAFFKKPFLSFADWSTETAESTRDGSRNAFRKRALPDYSSTFIFGDVFRRKVFFNYEKRLRLRSPPEKVFEYFASFRTPKGELLMRPADLMRAVVPVFPPSESHLVRDGYLTGERSPGELRCDPSEFFMLFDMNNDGLISFKEYIFFVTLLSIPESCFSIAFKMFDVDNNGEIDKEEFKKVMALMRANNRQGSVHRDGLRVGLKVTGSVENGGLVEYFFGKDGKACLQHDKFVQFMRNLQDEILRLEFNHYDYKSRGTISAKDFALSMVASADMSHLGSLLERVDELNDKPYLREIQINLDEFKHFAELRRKLQPFSVALFSYGKINGLLTKDDFKRAASHVCGISLTDNVVEIIFHVFDTNRDGNLSSDEFIRVLLKREKDIARPVESGIVGLLSCCWNCSNNSCIGWFSLLLQNMLVS
ncbi:calcium uptake protein, mitochondrial-like isoform X2 [Durio zibethinus]|uniref:Calcium uptake protein, mitochondrial-like isoform X2 n=1 Tax=Durio zibethinus TaxID=66656 RepID=A0A6P5ZBW2_DURZI|nr:calcium uptake protein, mitochondrial-like isoform X2 [Durio zibethinus]XP_022750299.1 calcium uptake protein, mitochondrial-like isoform X2 [Durio zibethinus]